LPRSEAITCRKSQNQSNFELQLSAKRGILKGAVLFRDKSGKLLGGDLIFIRNLPAKGTKPFMERLYFKGAIPDKFDQFDFLVFPSPFDWEKIVR
jgi:hypothetical protein